MRFNDIYRICYGKLFQINKGYLIFSIYAYQQKLAVSGNGKSMGCFTYFNCSGNLQRIGIYYSYFRSCVSAYKKFGAIPVKITEYHEGTLKDLQGGRKELWPYLLAFLMVVLAVEMGLANGAPWKKS